MRWLRRAPEPNDTERKITELEERCRDLEERLHRSDEKLRERSELLYELQRHYSFEHFELYESMRNLKIERLRNAGVFADRDIVVQRAKELQARIQDLKVRLKKHEGVEDMFFDEAPIVIESERAQTIEPQEAEDPESAR